MRVYILIILCFLATSCGVSEREIPISIENTLTNDTIQLVIMTKYPNSIEVIQKNNGKFNLIHWNGHEEEIILVFDEPIRIIK